jgi:hypothetical protein
VIGTQLKGETTTMPRVPIPLLALVGLVTVIGVSCAWCQCMLASPPRPIVVVNRRTAARALRQIRRAQDAGDQGRAAAGLTVLSDWLGGEVATGPRKHRAQYDELKTAVDDALADLRNLLADKALR